ncbi:MAG: hypothetical protein OHK003_27710 [Anaerolineales bacterium]
MDVHFAVRETPTIALLDRTMALETISVFREEWEAVAERGSLIDVSASVGLMLFDLTTRLGLTPQEQAQVLGNQLFLDALRKVNGNSI